jgi:hypothetical protein
MVGGWCVKKGMQRILERVELHFPLAGDRAMCGPFVEP